MRGLTFKINPDARFARKPTKRVSTRELLWLGQRKINPPQRSPEAGVPVQVPAGPCGETVLPTRTDFITNLVCSSNAVHRAEHNTYKTFIISTTLRRNGTWVASYGRRDGRVFGLDGEERVIAETIPYLAETLALAHARVQIDSLVKSQRSQARRRKKLGMGLKHRPAVAL